MVYKPKLTLYKAMTKEIVKKEESKPVLLEDALKQIRKDYANPDTFDNERNLLTKFHNLSKEKLTDEQTKQKEDISDEIAFMYGLENGLWATGIGHRRDYSTLARMRQKIIRDYDCKNSLELMLADSILACYWRIMKNEGIISRLMETADRKFSFDQLKVNVLKELNKEVDLANRRLGVNIVLLKEIKQPALKVNVKTNNAFIGENQQFNNNQALKDKNNESK